MLDDVRVSKMLAGNTALIFSIVQVMIKNDQIKVNDLIIQLDESLRKACDVSSDETASIRHFMYLLTNSLNIDDNKK